MSSLGAPDVAAAALVPETESSDAGPGGIQLIHEVPDGVVCVVDQVWREAPVDGRFEQMLAERYGNVEVAQALADANDLTPDAGTPALFIPPGVQVYFPAMCYARDGAEAVTLQASGRPEDSSALSNPAVLVALTVVIVGVLWVLKKLFS